MVAGQMDLTRPTALYRIFNERDELVYVGVSFTPETRWRAHARKDWWPINPWRTIEWLPDRPTARAAELAVIQSERPIGNIAGTPLNNTKTHIAIAAWKRHAAKRRAERERLLVADYVAGVGIREIAKRARLSHEGVRKMLRRHGIEA